ncbi:MAG: DUF4349 domain-containing protein [Dehalococcoidia bacterium]|nr:MAG: DUF4349 domain-containing protein [Dehalococcoidia bacterium]
MDKLPKVSIVVLLILGLVLISGCGTSPSVQPPDEGKYPSDAGQSSSDSEEPTEDRKIVKTGYITLEVEDIAETMDEVAEMTDELNGYVVSSYKYNYDQRVEGRIVIRVLFEKFDEAFARLRQLAIAVPYETTTATDVTEEYVDLEAQLSNLLATEAQYLTLMEKAETVEEMLKVQRELSNVRGQIEQLEGRMQYLERTSETALIEVNLQETKGLAEHWSASAALRSAVRGLTTFGRGLATVFIWLGIFCWAWVPPLVIWLRRRRRAKS